MQTQSKSLCYIIAIPKGMAIILESEVISMKNRKLLVAGLCGALCLSLAGFTHASAQATDAPKTSAEETAQMSSTDIFFNDADGISTDGENWVEEADYEKNNPAPDIEWWTAEEYEKWIATQKEELEALIGTGDGWYDGQGVFHEWTQESVDAMGRCSPIIMNQEKDTGILKVQFNVRYILFYCQNLLRLKLFLF